MALAPPALFAGQSSLSIDEVTQKTLAQNPTVAAARARWRMATQRIPQAAAWEDPKLNFQIAARPVCPNSGKRLHGSSGQPRTEHSDFWQEPES